MELPIFTTFYYACELEFDFVTFLHLTESVFSHKYLDS